MLSESLKSTQIEGTQISQDEMYYLKYMEETDDNKEIQNLMKTVEYAYEKINNGKDIDFELVNTMHRLLHILWKDLNLNIVYLRHVEL